MITIKDGFFGYNTQPLLENINLTIRKGSLIALVGENGSGKSTILKTLSGIMPLIKGEIFICNQDYKSCTPKELASVIAIVLSNQPHIPNVKVKDLVKLTSKQFNNKDKIQVTQQQAMDWTLTTEIKNKYCSQLSDGQLQRVFIARALAQDTPIVLMDEPTSHLDINHKYNFYNLLVYLTEKLNKTIIFTTHDLKNVSKFTNNFYAIKQKELTLESSISEEFFLNNNIKQINSFK